MWRSEARAALKAYPRIKRKQNEMTGQQITPRYDGTVVQHGVSRVTEDVALVPKLTEWEERVISAVEFAMRMQSRYYNADARMKMLSLVYFRRTHTLQGAAIEVGYNINTVKAWNTEILSAVYVGVIKAEKRSKKD